MKIVHL